MLAVLTISWVFFSSVNAGDILDTRIAFDNRYTLVTFVLGCLASVFDQSLAGTAQAFDAWQHIVRLHTGVVLSKASVPELSTVAA